MPTRVDRAMTSLILATSPLNMRSWIRGELSMISIAAIRPLPASRVSIAVNQAADIEREIHEELLAALLGKKLMMRSSAWLELLACSVASTRCPVSAN